MDPSSAVDRRLKEVQRSSESVESESRAKKYRPILEKVRRYFNKRKAVYYGGMAQNEYLPKKDRFYSSTDLPDYDVFASDPQGLARGLADAMRDEGYEFISVRHAFHDNTYKVSLDFEDIADITGVSVEDERRMRRRAKRLRDGTLLCPLDLLKANAHVELAMPSTAMFRWKKVFDRIKRLENAHPVWESSERNVGSPWLVESDAKIVEATKRMHELARRERLPIAGAHAAMFHSGTDAPLGAYMDASRGRAQVLSTSPEATATALRAIAKRVGLKGLRIVDVMPKCTCLEARTDAGDTVVLAEVHHVEGQCYGVREEGGRVYASAFYMLHDLYTHMYMTRRNRRVRAIIAAILRNLTVNDITAECYGTARSMLSAKRSKARKKAPLLFYEPGAS